MPFFKPKKPKQKFDFKPPRTKTTEKLISVEEQISIEKSRCAQMVAAAEAAVKARNFNQAEDLYSACLPIMEQVYAGDSKAMADCLLALGDVYYWQDKFGLALPIYQRLLAMRERMKDSSPASLVTAYFKVAKAQEHVANIEEARDTFKRAAEIAQKTLMLGHPLLTSVLESYANFLQAKTTNQGLADDMRRKAKTSRDTYVDPEVLKNEAEGRVGEAKWKDVKVSQTKDPTLWKNAEAPESKNPIVRALRKLREHPRLAVAFLTLPVSVGLLIVIISATYYLTGGERVQTPLVQKGDSFRSSDAQQSLEVLANNEMKVNTGDDETTVDYITLSNPWRELKYYYFEPHTRDIILYPSIEGLRDEEGRILSAASNPRTSTIMEMERFSKQLHEVNIKSSNEERTSKLREFTAKYLYENPYTHGKEPPNVIFAAFENTNSANHFVEFLQRCGNFDPNFISFRGGVKLLDSRPARTRALIKCIVIPDNSSQRHASFFVCATNDYGQFLTEPQLNRALVMSSVDGRDPSQTVGADEHTRITSTSRVVVSKVSRESINTAANLLAWVFVLLPIFAIFYKVFEPRFNRAAYENNDASLEVYLSYIYIIALAAYIFFFTAVVFYVMCV